jgi:DNA invertase Pin-like site-specific DNA recombinase
MAGMFAVMAELERDLVVERSQAARDALKSRGGGAGRKRVLTPAQIRQARALKASGESATRIAETMGVGRATVYRYLTDAAA